MKKDKGKEPKNIEPEKKETANFNKKKINLIDSIFKPQQATETSLTEAENVSLIIKEWLSKAHLRMKTRYTKRQVMAVSRLQSLADTYKIKTLQRFLTEFRTNKLSEDGKSSQELENILKSRMPQIEETQLEKLGKFLE